MPEYVDFVARASEKLEIFKRAHQELQKATIDLETARKNLDSYAIHVNKIAEELATELDNYALEKTSSSVETPTGNAVADGLSVSDSDAEETNTGDLEPEETAVSDESPEPKKASRKSSRSTKADIEKVFVTADNDVSDESELDAALELDSDDSTSSSSELSDIWPDEDDDDVDIFGPSTPPKKKTAASGNKDGLFDSTNVDEVTF